MKVTELADKSSVYSLLTSARDKTFEECYKDKYKEREDIIAFRIHGLIGDCIKATTALSGKLKENPDLKFVLLISYNDAEKRDLVKSLFSNLIDKGIVIDIFFNETPNIGNMSFSQFEFFQALGCKEVIDLYFFNSEGYKKIKKGAAYLGFEDKPVQQDKVALFRFSGFHKHVPLRHIPEEEWLELEQYLLDLGYEVHLYGYDDTMKTTTGVIDHRREFSILGTLDHASDSSLCISTTTFLPLYMHHHTPCLVYIDPSDLNAVSLLWRDSHNYMPINTQSADHLDFVKNFAAKHRILSQGTERVLSEVTQLVKSQV